MNKKEQLHIDKLHRLVEIERERAQKAFDAYRSVLYELVDVKMKLERIERVLRGEE